VKEIRNPKSETLIGIRIQKGHFQVWVLNGNVSILGLRISDFLSKWKEPQAPKNYSTTLPRPNRDLGRTGVCGVCIGHLGSHQVLIGLESG